MSIEMNSKKRTSAPVTSSTTEDLIALKKIKLLQQGQLKNSKRSETSNLASKINHNADKVRFPNTIITEIITKDKENTHKRYSVSCKSYKICKDPRRG